MTNHIQDEQESAFHNTILSLPNDKVPDGSEKKKRKKSALVRMTAYLMLIMTM